MDSRISSRVEPEPPWNTKSRDLAGMPNFSERTSGSVQDGRGQLDVTRLVYTVYVAEGGSDGETRADLGQTLVSVSNIFRLGVQSGLIHVAVVDAVFFATGATQFQLQSHVHLGHAGQVLAADVDVLFQRLFGQIQHVEENSGLPVSAKCFSPASSRPSIHGSSFLAAWSVCRMTGTP